MAEIPTVLAGDIGGTKTHLGLYSMANKRPALIKMSTYASRQAESLSEMVHQFLGNESTAIEAACFGVAGPVLNGGCKVTNLEWAVTEEEIRQNFNIEKVGIINDLMAIGYGLNVLEESETLTLNPGKRDPNAMVGLIAPGTGLGISILTPRNGRLQPWPSEGGHVDFAPRTDREAALWRYVRETRTHVSQERLVSGPGIQTIYNFLKDSGDFAEPDRLNAAIRNGDPSAVISRCAMNERDPICVETLNMFVSLMGASAGNLALMAMTMGGLYVGGGVPPKILPLLKDGRFMGAFLDKGRFADYLRDVPVEVVLNDHVGILGAATCAHDLCRTVGVEERLP